MRVFTYFLATKFVGKCSPSVSPFLLALSWVRMFCYSCPFTNSIPCQNIPDDFECFAMQIFITQIGLSFHLVTLIFMQFFRPWYESFMIWRFSDIEEQSNSHFSNCDHSRVNVCVYQKVRKVLQKKVSKYSRSSGWSVCQIIVFVLRRTNTTIFDHNDFFKCNESRF